MTFSPEDTHSYNVPTTDNKDSGATDLEQLAQNREGSSAAEEDYTPEQQAADAELYSVTKKSEVIAEGVDLDTTSASESLPNSPEILGYPKQNVELAVKLFENGLNATDEIIGYHGTSLETLQIMLKKGALPGAMLQSDTSPVHDPKDSLFFFPVKEKFPDHYLADKFNDHDEASKKVETYAELLAGAHYILSSLGMGIKNWEDVNHAKDLIVGFPGYVLEEGQIALGYFSKEGITKEQIAKLVEKAVKRKGVVLGLKKNILDTHTPTTFDEDGADMSIVVPEGLSIHHLAGIDTLSQDEWNFLVELQNESKK